MPVNTDSIQTILQAFHQGITERQQQEALAQRKEQTKVENEQRQQQIDQAAKQFQDSLKVRQDQFKLQQDAHALAQRVQEFSLKQKLANDIKEGLIPTKTKGFPYLNPDEKLPITIEGVTLQPNEYVTPKEYRANNPGIQTKLYIEELENARLMAQKIADQQFRRQQQEDQQSFMAGEHALTRQALQSRFEAGQEIRSKKEQDRQDKIDRTVERQDRKDIEAIVKEHDNNPNVRILPQLAVDEKQLLRMAKNVGKAQGADDVALAYIFARLSDPRSSVREGEVGTISEFSSTMAEKLGVNLRRIATSADRFTPAQRARIIQTLMPRLASIKQEYGRQRLSYVERIKEINPDYDVDKKLYNPFSAPTKEKEEIPTAAGSDLEAIRKAKGGK